LTRPPEVYSHELAMWSARAVLRDASLRHAFSAFVRALRLLCQRSDQAGHDSPGGLLRQLAQLIRRLLRSDCPSECQAELSSLEARLRSALEAGEPEVLERELLFFAGRLTGASLAAPRTREGPVSARDPRSANGPIARS
jgi:hypothetical protein